jgi:hypothetical protein
VGKGLPDREMGAESGERVLLVEVEELFFVLAELKSLQASGRIVCMRRMRPGINFAHIVIAEN